MVAVAAEELPERLPERLADGIPDGGVDTGARDEAEAAVAEDVVGGGARELPEALAPANSPARYYAEWVWAFGPVERGPLVAGRTGYIIESDDDVELSNFRVNDAGQIVDFTECLPNGDRCAPLRAGINRRSDNCAPAPGCPTVQSATGNVTLYLRATIVMHWPEQSLIYEIDAPGSEIASIGEPTGRLRYTPGSPYAVAVYDGQPGQSNIQVLLITYSTGETDEVRLTFNAPMPTDTGPPTGSAPPPG